MADATPPCAEVTESESWDGSVGSKSSNSGSIRIEINERLKKRRIVLTLEAEEKKWVILWWLFIWAVNPPEYFFQSNSLKWCWFKFKWLPCRTPTAAGLGRHRSNLDFSSAWEGVKKVCVACMLKISDDEWWWWMMGDDGWWWMMMDDDGWCWYDDMMIWWLNWDSCIIMEHIFGTCS